MIRLAIFGAAGRMGRALLHAAAAADDLRVSVAVEAPGHPCLGRDAGICAGLPELGVCLKSEPVLTQVDVAIDFSGPQTAVAHAEQAANAGKPLALGSTGLTPDAAKAIKAAAAKIPIVWAPNMSLGVNLLFKLARQAAETLKGYDIEIVEAHHRRKKDAPSGTALRLAEAAADGSGLDLSSTVHGRHGITAERPNAQIGMHAIRAGDIFGEHTVMFVTDGERIELTHRASGRECFASGALLAARWLQGRKPALYDMQDVLGFKD